MSMLAVKKLSSAGIAVFISFRRQSPLNPSSVCRRSERAVLRGCLLPRRARKNGDGLEMTRNHRRLR